MVILVLQDRDGCSLFGMGFVSNIRRNMLFYSVLQSLGGASYVARITLARKFIYNRTFLCGRNAVLLNGRKGLLRTINNTWVDCKETICNGLFYLAFQNGYPEDVISVYIKEKIGNFSADIKFGPQKCPVYLKLPWIGNSSLRFESMRNE